MSKNSKSPISPGTKENVQLNMKEFGQPSVKRDYTNSFACCIVNPFFLRKYRDTHRKMTNSYPHICFFVFVARIAPPRGITIRVFLSPH